jgi:uncharacterized membrane protein
MRALVRHHIEQAVNDEWPAMAGQHATLTAVPASLAEALRLALVLSPHSEGQKVAQREMVVALEAALDARRERIIVSESRVNWAKWMGVVLLAALTLLAIAVVHSENRGTTAIANGIFASAVAVCLLMIASQDRPFAGPFSVSPEPLVQVMPGPR